MKIYFAGTPGIEERERNWQSVIKTRLLSFWDIKNNQFSIPFAFNLIKKNYESIFGRSTRRSNNW
jgi:hypothetical protein